MSEILRILIIEADAVAAMILKKYLTKADMPLETYVAVGYDDAVKFLEHERGHILVIAEPMLPDMSPKVFLEKLQEKGFFKKITLCLLSVLYMEELKELLGGIPVACCFSKPIQESYIDQILNAYYRQY